MADTPALWAECEHGEGSDFLHYGDRNVRQVPAGALLIEDVEAAAHKARIELQINLIGEQEGSESLGESFEMVLLKLGWERMLIRLLRAAAGEGER